MNPRAEGLASRTPQPFRRLRAAGCRYIHHYPGIERRCEGDEKEQQRKPKTKRVTILDQRERGHDQNRRREKPRKCRRAEVEDLPDTRRPRPEGAANDQTTDHNGETDQKRLLNPNPSSFEAGRVGVTRRCFSLATQPPPPEDADVRRVSALQAFT